MLNSRPLNQLMISAAVLQYSINNLGPSEELCVCHCGKISAISSYSKLSCSSGQFKKDTSVHNWRNKVWAVFRLSNDLEPTDIIEYSNNGRLCVVPPPLLTAQSHPELIDLWCSIFYLTTPCSRRQVCFPWCHFCLLSDILIKKEISFLCIHFESMYFLILFFFLNVWDFFCNPCPH